MAKAYDEKQEKSARLLPIVFFLVFLAGLLYCLWLLWQQYSSIQSDRASQQARLELLLAQREELKSLLKLSPCEAAEKGLTFINDIKPAQSPTKATSTIEEKTLKAKEEASEALNPDNIEAACVFLVSLAGSNKLSTGSGFFVAPGYVVTNRHVVGDNPGSVLVTSKALGHPVKGKVVATGNTKEEDFAIVAIDIPKGANVKPLQLTNNIKKTQKVGAWGYPDIIGKNDPAYASLLRGENINAVPELSYSEGVISAILERNPRIIVHTAPISPGNSGGPLLNSSGDVVGINTMITLDEDSYRQASLALSSEDLSDFLRRNGVSPQ